MPEIVFFMTDEDTQELANELFVNGCVLYCDTRYHTPIPKVATCLREMHEWWEDEWWRGWYVLADRWKKHECVMPPFATPAGVRYSIAPMDGGPFIMVGPSKIRIRGDQPFVRVGHMGHYPRFWNPATSENEPVPDALKQCWVTLRRKVISRSRHIVKNRRRYYVTERCDASGLPLGSPFGP